MGHFVTLPIRRVDFVRAMRQCSALRERSGVIVWRSAAACVRGSLRTDAYGMVGVGEQSFGFFLEYDRRTENFRDYRRKLAAYHRCAETGRFEIDYEGLPAILIVTTSTGAEDRLRGAPSQASMLGERDRPLPRLDCKEWKDGGRMSLRV